MDGGFDEPIRDPLWGHVYLNDQLTALTRSAPFIRLGRIFQLGPTYFVYPGATHTRAAHSVGVYHLARRLIRVLAERGADGWISPQGVRSFLAAALLHDLGHFPYTHSLKELPLESHESLTARLILSPEMKNLVGLCDADPYMTAAIVDTHLPIQNDRETAFYRRLLSGVLDPDKLDYLNRDARYCGVPYGNQDVDFTFSRLIPHQERGIDIDSRLIANVEAVLFSKYLMYRSVYWHHSVRSATAMIKKSLHGALNVGLLVPEDLYDLDDQGLFALLASQDHPCVLPALAVRSGAFFNSIADLPYDEGIHKRLENLEERQNMETLLRESLNRRLDIHMGEYDLIIDLPENVSFETGLFIADQNINFSSSSTVFKDDTMKSFIRSLRVVRVFVAEPWREALESSSQTLDLLRKEGI